MRRTQRTLPVDAEEQSEPLIDGEMQPANSPAAVAVDDDDVDADAGDADADAVAVAAAAADVPLCLWLLVAALPE